MINVTSTTWWEATVAKSHTVSFRFELRDWTGALIQALYPISGSVMCDVGSSSTRTVSLSFYDDNLVPTATNTKLSPFYDNEIWIYYTISDGTTSDEVQVGIFRIGSLDVSYEENAVIINLSGYDRGLLLSETAYTKSVKLAGGTPLIAPSVSGTASIIDTIISAIQETRKSTLSVNYDGTLSSATMSTGVSKSLGSGGYATPWQDLLDVASSVGAYALFDYEGVLQIKSIPNLDTVTPIASYATNSVLLSASRQFDSSSFCNTVKYDGVGIETSALTVTYSPEPESSPFSPLLIGTRATVTSNAFVTTSDQLQDAVVGYYQLVRGYDVEVKIIPNPRLELYDVIYLSVPEISLDSVGMIMSMSIPLDAETPMTLTVRVRGY